MNYELLKDELVRDEGVRLKPYTDTVGKLTLGVGRNLTDKGISAEEAIYLLENDIRECEEALDIKLPWWTKQSEIRQRAMLNLCFNLGIRGLLTFRNTLKAWEEGRYQDAAVGLLTSKWARQVKGRAVRIADMVRNG